MNYSTLSNPTSGLLRGVGHEVAAVLDRLVEAPFVWAERAAERRHLAELDEHLLRDIGLTTADVDAISTRPFWRP